MFRFDAVRRSSGVVLFLALAGFAPSAAAQNYIFKHASLTTGNSPAGVVVADFDGDGKVDLAVTNASDNTVSILLALPNGGYAPAVRYATGALPVSVVAADFTRDGKPDLAILNEQDLTVSILLNRGDGTFLPKSDYATGNYPIGIVAADLNGDKKIDLAIANFYDNDVTILLGNADGSFRSHKRLSVGVGPTSIASGDFNGDGRISLLTSNIGDATVSALLNNGGAKFTRVDSPSGVFQNGDTSLLALGDFNKDGLLDVLASSQSRQQLFLLLGQGNGHFHAPQPIPNSPSTLQGTILAGDFNHDGNLDVAASSLGGVSVFLGKGNGSFLSPIVSTSSGGVLSFASADLNGDGKLDLAVTNTNLGSIELWLGDGKGGFGGFSNVAVAPGSSGPDWAIAADFNGDGKLDLAVAEENSPTGQLSVQLGTGHGKFEAPLISALNTSGVNANFMIQGDFNGDGKVDLFVLESYGAGFEILLGKGDGTFAAPVSTPLSSRPLAIAVGDFNHDGQDDLAITTNGSPLNPTLSILLSKGDGTFQGGAQYAAAAYASPVVADLNHDGKLDIVLNQSPLQVLLGKGDGTFEKPITGPTGNFTSEMISGDFNGDSKLDLVVGSYFGIMFFAGNGDGTFQAPIASDSTFGFTGHLLAGDFNGDGKLDLAIHPPVNTTLSGAVLMLGNGDGTFGPPLAYGFAGVFPGPIVVGDFNSDGVTDFAAPAGGGLNGTIVSLYLSSPSVNVFPNLFAFGNQKVGTTGTPLNTTLTNVGNAPLRIGSIAVTANFEITHSCHGEISIGDSCALAVTFTPTIAGATSGTVTVRDNAGSPQTIQLTGNGR